MLLNLYILFENLFKNNNEFLKCVYFYFANDTEYFRLSSAHPGVIYLKTNRDATDTSHNILRRADFTISNAMPLSIQPGGLSETWSQYLYKTVRLFVRMLHVQLLLKISRDVSTHIVLTDVISDLIKPYNVSIHRILVEYV